MSNTQISPHLDPLGLECLKDMLMTSINYLEYGSGGSTLFANNFPLKSIISIDSDKMWADKINSSIKKAEKFISINYCDIGPVRDWGIPIDTLGCKNYWKYITLPWKIASYKHTNPDLVLIDGRFRVACFMYSWIVADEGTTILFDDYTVRPEYHVLERITTPITTHGIMAKFIVTSKYDLRAVIDCLLEYSYNHE